MAAKVLLFLLLGSTLVLGNPVSNVNNKLMAKPRYIEAIERSIEEIWKNIEQKFSDAVDNITVTWEDVKNKGQDLIETNLEVIKEKGLKLLEDTKETFKDITIEGQQAAKKFKTILKSTKNLIRELKVTGIGAYEDAKDLLEEVAIAVREKVDELGSDN